MTSVHAACSGRRIPFKCQVNEVSFNGHADVRETTQFVKELAPKDIILVHGAKQQCLDLRKHLKSRGYGVRVHEVNAQLPRVMVADWVLCALPVYHRTCKPLKMVNLSTSIPWKRKLPDSWGLSPNTSRRTGSGWKVFWSLKSSRTKCWICTPGTSTCLQCPVLSCERSCLTRKCIT